tara:strand:- start:534 stop:662 length:129 start_codon:yes stop_codon:yes gene_type:complete
MVILPDENSSKLKSLKITIRNPKIIGEKTKNKLRRDLKDLLL